MLGFKKEIRHLDDRLIDIIRAEPTSNGFVQKLNGEGMPKYKFSSESGDLYVRINIQFPQKLSNEQRTSKFLDNL